MLPEDVLHGEVDRLAAAGEADVDALQRAVVGAQALEESIRGTTTTTTTTTTTCGST